MCVCVCACVRACVRVCVCVCVREREREREREYSSKRRRNERPKHLFIHTYTMLPFSPPSLLPCLFFPLSLFDVKLAAAARAVEPSLTENRAAGLR